MVFKKGKKETVTEILPCGSRIPTHSENDINSSVQPGKEENRYL